MKRSDVLEASWRCQNSIGDWNSVYAPRAVLQKASQNTVSNEGFTGKEIMSVALGWITTVKIGSETGALVYALGRVGSKARLPSP